MKRGLFLIGACLLALWAGPGLAQTQDQSAAAYKVPLYDLPAKMTLCGEPVPLHLPDVYERFDREFQLAVYDNAQVVMWLKRARRYFPHIEAALAKAGLPEDLKYLAVAESALKPQAYSPAGAAGVWQFMSATGRRFGLDRNRYQDNRYDFEEATRAALGYLRNLHTMLGSWALAMAAYNCGEERVKRELKEQGVESYYHLDLPQETERYLFRILAAKAILSDPEKYGYEIGKMRLYEPVKTRAVRLKLHRATHVRLIAQAAKTTYKEIRDLNQSIRGHELPAGDQTVRIPLSGAAGFEDRLAAILQEPAPAPRPALIKKPAPANKKTAPPKKESPRRYTVRRGDTLHQIASHLGVSVDHLRRLNRLRSDRIQVGQTLLY